MGEDEEKLWISRDYLKCTGCRRCEIACTLHHEDQIWPEASRVRVFMLVPGVEIPHLCSQCTDYPCVESCPFDALSVDEETSAVLVDREKCTACGVCIKACPGKVPHIHPKDDYILICDLCGGDPRCVRACTEAGYNALRVVVEKPLISHNLFARTPEELTRDVAENLYGEKAEELI
ncbi:MAG: 4Fe-4S dicluster domain-containing protein [Candidatus Bathyarchaeia archaeon]